MTAFALESGLTLLMAAHFVCVDIAMAGPLFALWLARRDRRLGDQPAAQLGLRLMHLAWQSLAVGVVLGLLAGCGLWLEGNQRFFTALGRAPASRLYWGVAELAVYFCLIIPCAFGWDRLHRRPVLFGVLTIAASTNLVYHFPPLFVALSEMAARPVVIAISSNEFRGLLFSPAVISRSAHHVLSAVAVVGVVVMRGATRPNSGEVAAAGGRNVAAIAARLALAATILQIPAGLWLLMELPAAARDAVLGSDPLATGLFLASMVAALGLLHYLAAAAMGDVVPKETIIAMVLLLVIVIAMTGALRRTQKHAPADGRSVASHSRDATALLSPRCAQA